MISNTYDILHLSHISFFLYRTDSSGERHAFENHPVCHSWRIESRRNTRARGEGRAAYVPENKSCTLVISRVAWEARNFVHVVAGSSVSSSVAWLLPFLASEDGTFVRIFTVLGHLFRAISFICSERAAARSTGGNFRRLTFFARINRENDGHGRAAGFAYRQLTGTCRVKVNRIISQLRQNSLPVLPGLLTLRRVSSCCSLFVLSIRASYPDVEYFIPRRVFRQFYNCASQLWLCRKFRALFYR